MIPVAKAIQIIDREVEPLGSEKVDIADSVGCVLSEDIIADTDMPPFDRSQMDGYAVRAEDTTKTPAVLRIVGESAAGRGWYRKLKKGEAIRIMTGAPVPVGADAVQKLEMARESSVSDAFYGSGASIDSRVSGVSDETVAIFETAEKGRFIVAKGSEIKKGRVLFQTGTVITEGMIAGIAAFGYAKVKVAQKPVVSIMSTGSEIIPVDKTPGRDQIRNSNSVMLKILCEQVRAAAKILPSVGDDLEKLKSQISKAANTGNKSAIRNPQSQILVITGGVSVGKYDLTKLALKELGAEIFFDRVRLKPGKPAVFAKLHNTLVFGLPGNPVSAAVTFYLFVRRAIRLMQNAATIDLRSGYAVAKGRMIGAAERDTYLPAELETNKNGYLLAKPLKWGGSSDFVGFAKAKALALIPRGITVEAGDIVKILFLKNY